MFRIAVFVSGGGTNLQAIIDQIDDGYLSDIEIDCVIASKPGTKAQTRAQARGIASYVISRKDYSDIASYDQALLNTLKGRKIDLVVLAGFLSLLGPDFVRFYEKKIINIHPSLIPAFCGHGLYGIKPHQAALEYGVKISGATVHFVDEQYDTGPILLQKSVPVKTTDTADELQQRVMKESEQIILPQAIRLIADGRVRFNGRHTIIMEEE